MSGTVVWNNGPEPIHHFNQPPVYLFMVALAGEAFGYSEIPLHLVQSLFTLIALFFFFRISRIVCPKFPKFLTALFAFCPAFLVNQNLMTDVPLVGLSLLFIWLLINPSPQSEMFRFAMASLVLGIAVLTKYTLLPLFVVLLISVLWKRQYRSLWVLLIPVAMIGLWSLWNLHEFGYMHILGRERDTFEMADFLGTSLSFMACLGAVAPFALSFFSGLFRQQRMLKWSIHSVFGLFCLLVLLSWTGTVTPHLSKEILRYLLLLNGMLLVYTILHLSITRFMRRNAEHPFGHTEAVIVFWFAGMAAFIIQFAPFIATRHILLAIPPILLIGSWTAARVSPVLRVQAAVATILLGLLLAVSDWLYADFYRQGAKEVSLALPAGQKVWTAGLWGWQWYAEEQGMMVYAGGSKNIKAGDYLVMPSDVATQKVDSCLKLVPVNKIWHPAGPFTFFSTSHNAAFYMSTYLHPAWRLSREAVDTIVVFRVSK